ncbi:MAG: hypothetical protein R3D02_15965 [Hyphomicrobiales bacterium]
MDLNIDSGTGTGTGTGTGCGLQGKLQPSTVYILPKYLTSSNFDQHIGLILIVQK